VSAIEGGSVTDEKSLLRSLITKANRFSYLGQHKEAVGVLVKAMSITSLARTEQAQVQTLLCESLLLLGHHDDALVSCAKAVELHQSVSRTKHDRETDIAKAWSTYGVLFERLGRASEALDAHDSSITADQSYAAAWHNRGVALEQLHRPAEAVQSYKESMRHGSAGSPDTWINLGNALRALPVQAARNEEALYSYSSAIALKPSFLGARFNKASLLTSMQRYHEAVIELTTVLDLDPSYRQARVARGNAHLGSQQLDRAEADYRDALRSEPQSVSELNNLCLVLHRLDRLEEALATCRDAIAVDGAHAWSWYNLGTTQHKLALATEEAAARSRLYEASISSYRRVVKDNPGWVSVWESLQTVLESTGRIAEAHDSRDHASALRRSLLAGDAGGERAASVVLTPAPVPLAVPPPPQPPPPPLVSTRPGELKPASAAEVAAHLERQRQTVLTVHDDKKVQAIPAASLTNLATQRLSLRSEHGHASVTPERTGVSIPAKQRLRPSILQEHTQRRVWLPNPLQPSKSAYIDIPARLPVTSFSRPPGDSKFPMLSRGIVIVASGTDPSMLREAYANIFLARRIHNSSLPVEVFYIGPEERFDPVSTRLFQEMGGVEILDLQSHSSADLLQGERMGFHAKSAAVLGASFDEVLLLDSDSMLFQAPEEFFMQPGYLQSGLLLFRDYQPCRKSNDSLH
jgi:tetratricopeptide (TPR) repeat protein